MKKLLILIGIVATTLFATSCSTSQQRTTYNTLAATEATATATVDGYFLAAAKGLASTNGITTVAKAYNDFQSTMQVAVILAQNNSNVLASSNVMQELSTVVSAVAQFTSSSHSVVPTP
jgi:hypothetical protein